MNILNAFQKNMRNIITAGIVLGASIGVFGGNDAKAQAKKDSTGTKSEIRDKKGRLLQTVETQVKKKESIEKSGKQTIEGQKSTVTKQVPLTPQELRDAYNKRRAKMTPAQREEEDRLYKANKAKIDEAAKKNQVKTVVVELPVGQATKTDSLTVKQKELDKTVVINNYIYKDSTITKDTTIYVPLELEEPRRPWLVSAGPAVKIALGDEDLYKGYTQTGAYLHIQSPQFGKKGTVGSFANAYMTFEAYQKELISSVGRMQDCGCVYEYDANGKGTGPQFTAKAGVKFGSMIQNKKGSINVNPYVTGGVAYQTQDHLTVTKGKQLTPDAKRQQALMYAFASGGITGTADLGGKDPKKGFGLFGDIHLELTSQQLSHTNPYLQPNGKTVGFDGGKNLNMKFGIAYKF